MVIAEPAPADSQPDPISPDRPPSRLHNFSFPSWGNQRVLRCVKLPTTKESPSPSTKKRSSSSSPEKSPEGESSCQAAATKPWNLRTRRAACHAPKENGFKNNNHNPSRSSTLPSTLQAKSGDGLRSGEPIKFSITLSKEEIEEDYILMKGTKPPRRPKKRSKVVQRQLDSLFPGLWLSEITLHSYKIGD